MKRDKFDDISISEAPPPGYFRLALGQPEPPLPYKGLLNPIQIAHSYDGDEGWPYKLWPYNNESVTDIIIGPFIHQTEDLDWLMEEAYRVLVPGGIFTVTATYYTHLNYFSNIRNITPITDDTFGYYCKKWCKEKKIDKLTRCNFDFELTYFYTEEWVLKSDQLKNFARKHYWNVVESVKIVLKKQENINILDILLFL